MATDDISVSIGVQGESKFKKALAECQNTVKQLDSALKANAAEYDANADALGENVERTKLLSKSIELQKKMAEGLGDAIEHATKKYGAASRQTTQYVVAQNKAKEAVAKLEKELKDTDREMEELGRDSRTVGQQLESGIGDAAEDTARSLEEMYNQLKGDLGDIKNLAGFSVMGDVAGGILDAAQNLYDFTESTRDYRRQISFLEQNAVDAGLEWTLVKGQLDEINTVTGDLDSSVEGISNLLATGFDSSELQLAVDALAGAVIKFPDTLKFESLADGLQETIATGTAVGAFAELLERNGIALDDFNKAMAKATTEEEKQQVALSFLTNHGLEGTYQGWQKNNGELIKAEEAQQKLTDKMAGLSEKVEPLSTAMTEMAAATVSAITELLENTAIDDWLVGVIGNITEAMEMIEILMDEDKLKKYGEGKKQERQEMIESGTAETEGEALLRQMGKPEWYIDYYKEQAAKSGAETGKTLIEETASAVEENEEALKTTGSNIMTEVANGVTEGGQAAVDNTAAVISDMQTSFDSLDTSGAIQQLNNFYNAAGGSGTLPKGWNLGSGGSGMQESGNPALQVSMNIDGTTFARVTAPYTSAALGRITEMTA